MSGFPPVEERSISAHLSVQKSMYGGWRSESENVNCGASGTISDNISSYRHKERLLKGLE